MRFTLHYAILLALALNTALPALGMEKATPQAPEKQMRLTLRPAADAPSLDDDAGKDGKHSAHQTSKDAKDKQADDEELKKDAVLYTLKLDTQEKKFPYRLIKYSGFLREAVNAKDKDVASDAIPLDTTLMKISLQELHDVLDIIANPAKQPVKDFLTKFIQNNDLEKFCFTADYLRIQPLLECTIQQFATRLLNKYNDKKFTALLSKLPESVQKEIARHTLFSTPIFQGSDFRELFDQLFSFPPIIFRGNYIEYKSHTSFSAEHGKKIEKTIEQEDDLKGTWRSGSTIGSVAKRVLPHDTPKIDKAAYVTRDLIAILNSNDNSKVSIYHGHKTGRLETEIQGMSWSPDNTKIASWDNASCHVWNIDDGSLRTIVNGGSSIITCSWSHDGKKIAMCYPGNIRIFSVIDGTTNIDYRGHQYPVYHAVWSEDDTKIASRGSNNVVHVWDTSNGSLLNKFHDVKNAISLRILWLDNQTICSLFRDETFCIWTPNKYSHLFTIDETIQWLRIANHAQLPDLIKTINGSIFSCLEGTGFTNAFNSFKQMSKLPCLQLNPDQTDLFRQMPEKMQKALLSTFEKHQFNYEEPQSSWSTWLYRGAAVLAAGALGYLAYRYFRKK